MPVVLEGKLADLSAWKPQGCSIAKALDIVGTRSAMLILRECFYGTTRFDGFATRVGITDAAASSALRKLTEAGLLEKRPYREEGKRTRHEYALTPMGSDLLPAVLALWQWGDEYLQDGTPPLERVEDTTGEPVRVEIRSASGNEVPVENLRVRVNKKWRRPA
ncbi:helix-turn-helix transcriptional regulator [Nocardia sp. NBC_01503]|uniref:winged helix-turn-helix transcriptional regulator n=1 Tax=Nocardia sp. NBC_01503 TaxID=2975997 RepID=UPI002E7C04DC|nr:helix-turn-helix domain-containing protein [Nocardia sp. NBC_01503]WTL34896.1 helix-turn-helix transcriptional regulator [Nocardia sp. NBC_01503]